MIKLALIGGAALAGAAIVVRSSVKSEGAIALAMNESKRDDVILKAAVAGVALAVLAGVVLR